MRILAVLAVLAALGWGGYWVAGSRALDRAISEGLARMPQVQVAGHAIRGFPNRFDVTLDAPRVRVGPLTWSAPFVQVFALSYRLNHLLAVFAHDQRLTGPGLDAALHSEDLRASVVMEAGLDLPLARATLVGEGLTLSLAADAAANGAPQSHQAGRLRAASRRIAERRQEWVLLLEDTVLDPRLMDRIDPERLWPRVYQVLRLDGEIETDRPLDRHLVGAPPPRVVTLDLTGARATWDGGDIAVAGRLTPGPDGRLSGQVRVSITGFRDVLARARASGLIPADSLTLLSIATQSLTDPDAPETLHAELAVTDGVIGFGPLVLGQIPPIF